MIKAVLFDLDGTLLPMNMETFTGGYFRLLAKKASVLGYEPEKLIKTVWDGTRAMVKNDGSCTNKERFWQYYVSVYGEEKLKDRTMFDAFYEYDFGKARAFCGFTPAAAAVVRSLRRAGVRTVLATNPLFPDTATRQRIAWAGLEPSDFELYTTYDNCRFCKPNPLYYREVLERAGLAAEECLMVGNDAEEDLIAETLGMRVFLITDCLINAKGRDITGCPQGSFTDLAAYLREQGLYHGSQSVLN